MSCLTEVGLAVDSESRLAGFLTNVGPPLPVVTPALPFGSWRRLPRACLFLAAHSADQSAAVVVEPSNLMSHMSACLLLDTKHSRENTKLLGSIGHTTGENPKIHIFAVGITNERIKLTSF